VSHYKGVLKEVLLESYQNASGVIGLREKSIPRPGQYLQAHTEDPLEVVPTTLFPAGVPFIENGEALLHISGSLPEGWSPGTKLNIRGPLGNGFSLPKRARRLALISLGPNLGNLLPLAHAALQQKTEVALLAENTPINIPLGIEMQGLSEVSNAVAWADHIAVAVSADQIETMQAVFVATGIPKRLAIEVLVLSPMPCGGNARCGVCALETSRGIRFPCEDGPVFALPQILMES
jgi:hypothetical protein